MCRSPAHKVFPAMYIEGVTELAFADVTLDDPDFAYIQGDVAHIHVSSRFLWGVKSTYSIIFEVSNTHLLNAVSC